jgi:hypothetical protein
MVSVDGGVVGEVAVGGVVTVVVGVVLAGRRTGAGWRLGLVGRVACCRRWTARRCVNRRGFGSGCVAVVVAGAAGTSAVEVDVAT